MVNIYDWTELEHDVIATEAGTGNAVGIPFLKLYIYIYIYIYIYYFKAN